MPLRVDLRPPLLAPEARPAPVVEEHLGEGLGQHPRLGEVGVVAAGLAGERHVQRVVHVVGPLRRHARPPSAVGVTMTGSLRSDSATRVSGRPSCSDRAATSSDSWASTWRGEESRSSWTASSRSASTWKSRSQRSALSTTKRRTTSDPVSSRLTAGPRGRVLVGEVRPEVAEVVATRPEVVVDHVEADPEAPAVAGVDEPLEGGRAAVRVVDGVEADAVVAQPHRPGKAATGMTSTTSTPSATRWSRRRSAASKVPSAVNVPTCSS